MAPRAIWTGSITFGLVNVPVRIYSAIHEHKLHFNLVHEKDDGPIGYQKVCKLEDKPVSNDEIVKVFEIEKGEFVRMTDEDFEAVQVEGQHTIDVGSTKHLPPCPKCGNGQWNTVTGGDAADDPYPDS